jgi:hypothetical protein
MQHLTGALLLLVVLGCVAQGKEIIVGQGEGGWTIAEYPTLNASVGDVLVSGKPQP